MNSLSWDDAPRDALAPGLYLVATPIGNPGDMGLRALDVLRRASIVGAEDTRVSAQLLEHYELKRELVSYHSYNEEGRSEEFIAAIERGESVAIISDAGLPLISDPGSVLLRRCAEADLPITVIPGPSAGITALCGSGLDASRFLFYGFLPKKAGKRKEALASLLEREETVILYEAPGRVPDSLKALAELAPERGCVLARELTKRYETYYRGTCASLAAGLTQAPRGECILLLEGREAFVHRTGGGDELDPRWETALRRMLERGLSVRDCVEILCVLDETLPQNTIYDLALSLRDELRHAAEATTSEAKEAGNGQEA